MKIQDLTMGAFLIGLLVLSSCGGSKNSGGTITSGFKLASIDGDTISLADLKGKVVLVDFWATWCPPCRAYIPHLIVLHDKYKEQGLVILGISSDGPDAIKQFKTEQGIKYQLLISDNETMRRYEIKYIPTTYLYDRKGKLVKKEIGFDPNRLDQLEEEIKKLLSK